MSRLLVILSLLALAACATAEGYRQKTSQWVGAHADQLLLDWGPPVDKSGMSEGREMWTYFVEESYTTGGNYTQVPHERWVETVDEDGERIKRKETVYESVYNPPVDHFTQCETRFVIAPDGYVETFSFQGDACVAVEES